MSDSLFLTIVLFSFIDTLRREQKNVDADYTRFMLGRNPPPKAKKYRDADQRLFNLVANYVPLILDQNAQINFQPNIFTDFDWYFSQLRNEPIIDYIFYLFRIFVYLLFSCKF